jgi:hypothetical protein
MPVQAPSFVMVHPSFLEPEIILPYAQASGAFDLIQGGEPRVRLEQNDLYVYMKRMDVRTQIASGQAGYNQLPSVVLTLSQISAPTYLFRVRAQWDSQDEAAGSQWGFGLPEGYRLGMRQAHFQLARNALLYGINPQNGEGLANTPGATAVNLPPDTNNNDTVVTYDNGQMALFLLQQIELLKTRTNQLGIGRTISICGPQRVLGQFEYPNIVQLTSYQRPGAGSSTTAGVVKNILDENEDNLLWTYDDTLIGKGQGGNDLIIITMPEIDKPMQPNINTNEFAKLEPGNNVVATMYASMAAPMEITSPMAGGATDVLSQWRTTSGWGVRPEGILLISMQYQ